jgi:CheY-like chemotaxis protein
MTFAVSAPEPRGAAQCLVVDDEPLVRRSLVRLLEAQGFSCLEAGTGREAIDRLDDVGEIPLIVSDMRMPELDGLGTSSTCAAASPIPPSSC